MFQIGCFGLFAWLGGWRFYFIIWLFTYENICVPEAYIYIYMCVFMCLQRPEKGVRSLGSGVTDGCEQPCGLWELNRGPLQEQAMLLTMSRLHRPINRFP